MSWRREVEGGVEIHIRLTPRADRDAIEGVETGADGRAYLRARVRAVPEDGKANAALVKLVAKMAGAAKSNVALVAGATGRMKTLRICANPQELMMRLDGALSR
jgi:uncharacterized protein (TIGR00251 family)